MLRTGLRGSVIGVIAVAAGCTSSPPSSSGSSPRDPHDAPALPVPDVSSVDGDRNRMDDTFDADARTIAEDLSSTDPVRRSLALARADEQVPFEAVFSRPMPGGATAALAAAGGSLRYVFRALSYGFNGRVPRSKLGALAAALGPDLVILKAEQTLELHLDEATKGARVRAVWAPGFAGSTAGFNGSSTINIAIIDGGVDPTHPDLAGRMIGWKDYTSEAKTTASDALGHGSHVAGIALGSGASFGVGPGTLRWTDSGDASALEANDWIGNAMHFPPTFQLTTSATFLGGGSTIVSLLRGDEGKTVYTSLKSTATGASPVALTFDGTAVTGTHFTLGVRQNAAKTVEEFAAASSITNYPAVGDGFPAMRGVAPGSGWYAAKIFPVKGVATSSDINEALDDIALIAKSLNIKVVNCSFGISGGGSDPTQRAKANALVDRGVVVVSSSANNGGGGTTGDPGRASKVITVGAVNDINQLTSYSSGLDLTPVPADADLKPDLIAPGGSSYRSKILSVDTNTSEATDPAFADVQPDDYTSILGTSMAAPLVAGASILLIQALESKGHVWSWDSSASPLLVKMLLSASATETNALRETNANNPTLGRAASPKDRFEGYGMINPDAAIEAATMTWDLAQPIVGGTDGAPSSKRAWGRKIKVPAGATLKLVLTESPDADFDVYVYKDTPTAKGNPQLNAWSDSAVAGIPEITTWRFLSETELYVFVKRIAGAGTFVLSGATFTCGNGVVEPGEQCDDNNTSNGDCCSTACQLEPSPCGAEAGAPDAGAGDGGATDASTDGAVTPQGTDDAGVDAGEVEDAGVPDAAVEAAAPPPPFKDPDPNPTGPPATAPPAAIPTTPVPPPEVERFDAGGGCMAAPHGDSGLGALGIVAAWALAIRRGRRRRAG